MTFPQAHVIVASSYFGWMSFFMTIKAFLPLKSNYNTKPPLPLSNHPSSSSPRNRVSPKREADASQTRGGHRALAMCKRLRASEEKELQSAGKLVGKLLCMPFLKRRTDNFYVVSSYDDEKRPPPTCAGVVKLRTRQRVKVRLASGRFSGASPFGSFTHMAATIPATSRHPYALRPSHL